MTQETFVDKSSWREGPWKFEPDKCQWVDEATGLDCLIVRGPCGALCGYVGVPECHPAFGKEYDKVEPIRIHGGLTYAALCQEDGKICHVPQPGRPERVWWLGFDCAHSGDRCPKWDRIHVQDRYRALPYVTEEVASLASQLAAMSVAAA